MSERVGLTPVQAKAYDYIEGYMLEHRGVAPSYEEIRAAMGLASRGAVNRVVTQLEARGWLTRIKGRARAMACVKPMESAF